MSIQKPAVMPSDVIFYPINLLNSKDVMSTVREYGENKIILTLYGLKRQSQKDNMFIKTANQLIH